MATGLWAQEMDHTSMIEENWSEIQGYMTALFEWQGADTLAAEELAMLPGMDELFGLLMVRRHNQEGRYDALILDAAPTGETLFLSLPDHMNWYVEKIFPIQRRAAKLVGRLRTGRGLVLAARKTASSPRGRDFTKLSRASRRS